MVTKAEIKTFLTEWKEKPFPKKVKGDNKGKDKWDIIPSKLSKHLLLVRTTDNEFLIKIVNDGYKGILTASFSDMESIAKLFSVESMKEIKVLLSEFKSHNSSNPNSVKTNSVF